MSDAPERIWAWTWNLPYLSRSQFKPHWDAFMCPSDQSATEYVRADIVADLLKSLKAVVAIADRDTDEFNAARAAISAYEAPK